MRIIDIIGLIALFIFPAIPFVIYGVYKIKKGKLEKDKSLVEDGFIYMFAGFIPMVNITLLLGVASVFTIIGIYSIPLYLAKKIKTE